jgi:hypothetical protein
LLGYLLDSGRFLSKRNPANHGVRHQAQAAVQIIECTRESH